MIGTPSDFRDVSVAFLCTWCMYLMFCLTKMTFDIFQFYPIEKFTCVAVFIISDNELVSEAVLKECVIEKFALIPDHAKLLVGASWFNSTAKVPETLHVNYGAHSVSPFFTLMIEIFNKRWQTLDLISMMHELKRATIRPHDWSLSISFKDTLTTLPTFQKKEEEHS